MVDALQPVVDALHYAVDAFHPVVDALHNMADALQPFINILDYDVNVARDCEGFRYRHVNLLLRQFLKSLKHIFDILPSN